MKSRLKDVPKLVVEVNLYGKLPIVHFIASLQFDYAGDKEAVNTFY